VSGPTPMMRKFVNGDDAWREVPRRERLVEVVCDRKSPSSDGRLVGVVSPRSFDPSIARLHTSQGAVPLTGRHVLGAHTDTPIVDRKSDWFGKCSCGEVHAIPLEPLVTIVTSMRKGAANRLPFRVSVSTLVDAVSGT
jgi:hypothetical protein